jgi:high-affinity iron transporter
VSTVPAWQPLTGAALGLLTAVVLGYLLYRGAVRINLGTFFTWTGAFLIVVAAGVLGYGFHDLQEAGILPGLNSLAFDVSGTIDEGSWYGALLKGVFNFSPQTTWLQAVAWVAYLSTTMSFFVRGVRRRAAAQPTPAPARQKQPARPALPDPL